MNAAASNDVVSALWMLLALAVAGAIALPAYRRLQRATREVAARANELEAALGDLQSTAPRFYYLRTGGLPQGPVELTTLRAMVIDGRLDGEALAAPAGTDRWRRVGELLADGTAPGTVRAGSQEPK